MSILFLKNIAFYAYYVPKRYAATARYANRVRVCVNPPYADLLRNIRAALLSLIRYKVRYADHGPLLCAAAKPVQLLIQPLLLLLMTLFLGVDQTQAQGINLLYFLPTAGMSLLEHRKNGYLDREVMRAAIPLGTLAALAAAWAATSVDITVFRRPFGVFLLWAGANMLLRKKK